MNNAEINNFDLQPTLENEIIKICPVISDDFETLYAVASDPLIWEQHPNKHRYKREVFENFFEGAIDSKGAFLIFDTASGKPIGSSRYYICEEEKGVNSIAIGYTFLAKENWGTTYNRALKTLMLNHAFKFVDKVFFHIGALNIRSQKAIEKLGAKKFSEKDVTYHGEQANLNFVYVMEKDNWENLKNKF